MQQETKSQQTSEQFRKPDPYAGIAPGSGIPGQQLSALQKAASDRMRAVLSDIELRKWAISEAGKGHAGDFMARAKEIHAFLTEGAAKEIQADLPAASG